MKNRIRGVGGSKTARTEFGFKLAAVLDAPGNGDNYKI